jgi:hypothetical protein
MCVSPGGFSTHDANSSVSVESASVARESQSFRNALGSPHCLVLSVDTLVRNSQPHRIAYNVTVLSLIEPDGFGIYSLQSNDRPS